ncbi:uncharacterized protein EV420DRAFT_1770128 [Desarmillaria tabescens]|uniref:Protein kinase domain-containing protein n=1 Tax=Armillaria tabescens TaxID=1929756 RepID=A0AA39MKK7_ARMTA|nr:uncharacterized protein EV420DRAFT_1770128 [Desarmillaria tabescens]KAK0437134.1 hypothetical protein EV420DRAFT_1770128 [Desarmillaria tabescens]
MAFSYQTLRELELLPPSHPDLAITDTSHISRGMTPLSESQIAALTGLSDVQKSERSFTASVDSDLLSDLLLALDKDLSRSTAFADRYAEYHDAVKDQYNSLLSLYNNDMELDESDDDDDSKGGRETHPYNKPPVSPPETTVSEPTVDSLSKVMLVHASSIVLDFIPECRLQYRNRVPCGSLPGLQIVPSATLSYPNRSSARRELSTVINEGVNPLRFYLAATELVERLNGVGSVQLDYPGTFTNNQDNWWLLLNKGALYLTEVNPTGANILLYYSCNAFLVLWRQRNESSPDHIFISDVKGNFRGNSLEQQFYSVSDAGLQRARTVFPEPDGGYRPYPHIHDVYLALTIVAALAVNPSYAEQFPSLEAFRTQRRTPPPAKPSSVYDVHGQDIELSESDGSSIDTLASPPHGPDLTRALETSNQLHGCASEPIQASLVWGDYASKNCKFSCLVPTLVGRDIVVQSEIRSSIDGYTYLANVRGLERKLVLKVFRFDAFAHAEFSAYMDLKALQGSIIPACYGFGYDLDLPWILLEYINPPPSFISLSDLKQISRPHRGKIIHAVKLLHQLGYRHGELLDDNIVWTVDEDPVIIDLVSARKHRCGTSCREVEDVRQHLGLTHYDAELWSLVVRPTREQEAGMFVGGKPRSPQLAEDIEA